ncbi:MAG TPA: FAD-dependent oxidoreductase, partial [Castellaniella sp.]|nr:FAD-dependent oxidoreductase [Castellaniella sp.]
MSILDLNVPDIGDFDEVEVIEVLVAVGDTIEVEQSLITVESDKASMEIPAEQGGVLRELLVKVGDKIAQGTTIARIETESKPDSASDPSPESKASKGDDARAAKPGHGSDGALSAGASGAGDPPAGAPVAASTPAPAAFGGSADETYDVLVLGAGPGGYSAAFRAADLGLKVALVERYETLGGVCLNVGCIPSKALLHTVGVLEEAQSLAAHGISFGAPAINLDGLRDYKDGVVAKLTGGLAGMARARKVTVIQGVGQFLDPHHLSVAKADGQTSAIRFDSAIIAAGSRSVRLPFLPEDPRIVDSTGALALQSIPERMLIIGGGIIGLEMGTVYSALGARLDVVEMLPTLMTGADRDLVKVWDKMNARRFDHVMLKTKTVAAKAKDDGIWVTFEGEAAPKEPQRYDLVLQAVGRAPNG